MEKAHSLNGGPSSYGQLRASRLSCRLGQEFVFGMLKQSADGSRSSLRELTVGRQEQSTFSTAGGVHLEWQGS